MRLLPYLLTLAGLLTAAAVMFCLRRSGRESSPAVHVSDLRPGPIRHPGLPAALEARVVKFEAVFAEVYSQTHQQWIDGFLRDDHPESEIAIWESIASAYTTFVTGRQLSLEAKKEAFGLLLVRSSNDEEHTLSGAKLRYLSSTEASFLLHGYDAPPQPILYEKR